MRFYISQDIFQRAGADNSRLPPAASLCKLYYFAFIESQNLNYIELAIQLCEPSFGEILEAELAEIHFESFEQQGKALKAYVQAASLDRSACEAILASYEDHIEHSAMKEIEHTNWNAVWEANYPPVSIDQEIFIGASFHEVPTGVRHAIILEPNMSFGTGHHPTTELVLRQMIGMELENCAFMDFGCGSAILSIYAAMKGAHGTGVEIDAHAADAARDNLERNQTQGFDVRTGGIEHLKGHTFDVIAANINRNVIEECLPQFKASLSAGGWLLCSGFLTDDTFGLKERLSSHGFHIERSQEKDGWAMLAAKTEL